MMKLLSAACVLFGWLHASALAPDSEIVYRNEQLALTFAAPARGAGLLQIRNLAAGHDFWSASSDKPLLWNICFSKVGTNDTQHLWVDNRNAPACRAEIQDGKLVVTWDNLAIGTIKDAFSVRLTVAWDAQGAANLWLEPTLHTTEYSFRDLLFPCREQVLDPAAEEVLFPRGNIGSRLVDYPISGTYPGCESQLQFFGWFKKAAPGGIYLGLHDAAASGKFFSLNQQRNLDVLTYAENITVPGQSRFPRYPVVIAATETPWTACALYRDWALQQQWTRKGKLADRTDIPADAGDIELWFNMAGAPDVVGRQFATEVAAGAGKTAIHWYCWNLHPFDTHYPDFFPALPGFAENVAAMQADGHYVVPYINGRLWDVSLPDFAANGSAGATMRADGSTTIEDYGSGATLAAMCPTSKAYQQKIMDAFTVFVEEYQIKGVYIDQIGAAAPVLCYNPEHGHPLGGGGWWQEAYREMLEPIVKRYGDRVLIATENGAEPYMDTISSFLLWMAVFPDDFPSLPAVYNQYAWYFCSPVTADDNRNEFCALLSRCLLWGIQPGWLPWLHDGQENTPEKEWKKSYIATMTALRRHAAKTLIHGVLVDEVSFVNPVGTIPVEFKRNAQYGGTSTPGKNVDLTGAIWRSADGESLAIALAELSGNEREVEFEFAPERYGVSAAGKKLYRLHADGMLELVHDGALPVKFTMAPHDLQVYLWQAPAARQ